MTGEDVRFGVHQLSGLLAFTVAMHNTLRFVETKRPRNAINAVASFLYCALELANTREHMPPPEPEVMLGIGA